MASTVQTRAKLGWFQGDFEGGDAYKVALFTTSYAASASVTQYTATNEAAATGYTAGGANLTTTMSNNSTKAIIDFADVQWTITGTLAFQYATVYDTQSSNVSNMALCILDFGSQSITNGTVTIQWPTPDSSSAILRLA